MLGVGWLAAVGGGGWRRPRVAAAVAGGVLWSNALGYGGVSLAPHDQLAELERIGERIDGPGADADDRVRAVRRAPLPPRLPTRRGSPSFAATRSRFATAARSPKGGSADTDRDRPGARSATTGPWSCAARRPRAGRRRRTGSSGAATYYEAWQRPAAPAPLREAATARRSRRPVRRAGLRAGAGAGRRAGPLVAAGGQSAGGRRAPAPVAPVEPAHRPGSRPRCGSRGAATYEIWLGGSLRPGARAGRRRRAGRRGPPRAQQRGRVRPPGRGRARCRASTRSRSGSTGPTCTRAAPATPASSGRSR